MINRILILLTLFLSPLVSIAQELSVKTFEVRTNDLSARTQSRQDNNGNDCALVKVQLAASGAKFEGNVVGDVKYDTSEYWVYMPQGSKRLTIKVEGYLPLNVSFEDQGVKGLEAKTTYVMTVTGIMVNGQMQEAPRTKTGWIILDSSPQGASVYINGNFVGNTPLNNYKQAYGTYSYRLEHPNYHDSSGTIDLNDSRIEKTVTMTPAFGSIRVTSNTAGATVLLDGKSTGKVTPCTLEEVPSGQHSITIQLDKYAPRQLNVNVEDGKTAQISAELDARFANVTINSVEGAEIFSNGKLLGTSKYVGDMMEGFYDVEVRLTHHKPASQQLQVTAGKAQNITLKPTPIYGSLDVVSTPHDAEITIDGKSYGKTPNTIENLLEGEHTILVSKEEYQPYKSDFLIQENQVINITAQLEKKNNRAIHISPDKPLIPQLQERQNSISSDELIISGVLDEEDWKTLRNYMTENKIKVLNLQDAEINYIINLSRNDYLTKIILPNSVTSIGDCAFYGCSKLTSIVIPNSVTSIGSGAFQDCSNLTSIVIPNSVTSIGQDAFRGCSVTIPIYNSTCFAYMPESYKGAYRIPNGITNICDGAFCGCSGLLSVTIPNSVTSIGYAAFQNCSNLTSIDIPNSVTSIGSDAFAGTPWYMNKPDGLIYCGKVAYKYKGYMPPNYKIIIENGTVSIANRGFENCSNLTSIIIPNSVTSIGDNAFEGCSKLTSIVIPNSVASIGYAAFRNCSNLTSIDIPNSVTSIGPWAFDETPWGWNKPNGLVYCGKVAYGYKGNMPPNSRIIIEDGTVSIADGVFEDCSNLTSIVIPNSVTHIGQNAFLYCSGLTSIDIPNSVTYIEHDAFHGCSNLTSIIIPPSVTYMGTGAFHECEKLQAVKIPKSLRRCQYSCFGACSPNLVITEY